MEGFISILDVVINRCTAEGAIKRIEGFLHLQEPHQVFIVNAHTLNLAWENPRYRDILNSADLVLNDGVGLNWAARLFGDPFPENLVGTDFIPRLMGEFQEKGYSFYFLGSPPGVAEKAAHNLRGRFPRLRILGAHHGYFAPEEEKQVISEINRLNPDILLVGLGNPFQEEWIHRNFKSLNVKVSIGVGAFFDYMSGRVRRAPRWMLNNGMEWVFRLLVEPKRLWRRYLVGNPKFIFRVGLSWLAFLWENYWGNVPSKQRAITTTFLSPAQLRKRGG